MNLKELCDELERLRLLVPDSGKLNWSSTALVGDFYEQRDKYRRALELAAPQLLAAARLAPTWISVEERPPPWAETLWTAWFDAECGEWIVDFEIFGPGVVSKATHYMPLPPSPLKEGR